MIKLFKSDITFSDVDNDFRIVYNPVFTKSLYNLQSVVFMVSMNIKSDNLGENRQHD
jgi:hypothetical protein